MENFVVTWVLLPQKKTYSTLAFKLLFAPRGVRLSFTLSAMLDEPNLCTLLLTRLTDQSQSFSLRLYLDRVQFHKGTCHFQLARVTKLQREGALVYLCDGVGRLGSWHN